MNIKRIDNIEPSGTPPGPALSPLVAPSKKPPARGPEANHSMTASELLAQIGLDENDVI